MAQTLKIFDSVDELALYFTSLLVARVCETPRDDYFSWVLSGGKTAEQVFGKMGSSFRNEIPWQKVKIFWGDERCVGPEDAASNFRSAKETLLDHLPVPPANIYRIRGEAGPKAEAERYAELFNRNVPPVKGIPRADFIMLGLGEDGHTASIFTSNIHFFTSDKFFEPAEHPVTKQKRITMTGKIINHAKTVVFIATGRAKATRTAQIIHRTEGYDLLPAAHVCPAKGELFWLLDRQAAFNLK
ncbi:MAG: 6-phosphogluconolactonase [Bacteroidota bacterium]